jgi:acyl carrier protein
MFDWDSFLEILRRFVKVSNLTREDVLFGDGLALSSIAFAEFIMQLEEDFDVEVDLGRSRSSLRTVGDMFDFLTEQPCFSA